LTDFIQSGLYDRRREFFKTESPSMDILISSNLERLLFELSGRNAAMVTEWMGKLTHLGWYSIPGEVLKQLQGLFYGGFADQTETLEAIRMAFTTQRYLMDPHTAVGYGVLQKYRKDTGDQTPALLTSTASPFKFNRAVLEALDRNTGDKDEFMLLQELSELSGLPVPEKLAELKELPELHPDVCAQYEMAEILYRFLGMH
jgi:threonine synthase